MHRRNEEYWLKVDKALRGEKLPLIPQKQIINPWYGTNTLTKRDLNRLTYRGILNVLADSQYVGHLELIHHLHPTWVRKQFYRMFREEWKK